MHLLHLDLVLRPSIVCLCPRMEKSTVGNPKYNTNNLILILTLTLTNPHLTLIHNPNRHSNTILYNPLVSKLAKAGRSIAGFMRGALPDLKLFL